MKIAISASSTVLRGSRREAMVSSGAPTATPTRIAGDQQAGGGDGDVKIGRDLQQQAHDDEFGGADAKGTGGEGEEGDGHDASNVPALLRCMTRMPADIDCCELKSQMPRIDVNRSGEMEAFVQVVERGGFSAGARALGMTPSAVSKLVARLEARLAVQLVHRSTRKLQLDGRRPAVLRAQRARAGRHGRGRALRRIRRGAARPGQHQRQRALRPACAAAAGAALSRTASAGDARHRR